MIIWKQYYFTAKELLKSHGLYTLTSSKVGWHRAGYYSGNAIDVYSGWTRLEYSPTQRLSWLICLIMTASILPVCHALAMNASAEKQNCFTAESTCLSNKT
jgi:hypothetical protein